MIEINLNDDCNYIHLLSGGLDSSYNLLKIANKLKKACKSNVIHPVFFDYGHFASDVEWKSVKKVVKHVRELLNDSSLINDPLRISLKSDLFQWCRNEAFIGKEKQHNPEIENRNMVLFSILASYLIACAEHQKISSTHFEISSGFKERELTDSTQDFFTQTEKLLKMYKENFTFHFDILERMKHHEVINGIRALLCNSDEELKKFVKVTISCYSPLENGNPCGECYKCSSLKREGIIWKKT